MKVNAIQTIENAITGSKLNLKTQYEVGKIYMQDKKNLQQKQFWTLLSWYFRTFVLELIPLFTGGRANENLW